MKCLAAIFDLDGTITDSCPGILNAIRYALQKHGMKEPSQQIMRSFIGPPLCRHFQEVFGLTDEEGAEMVSSYREYYAVKGIFENSVYPGVEELLEKLKDAGVKVLMATSKPEKYALMIAEHFGFAQYFDFIGGSCMDGSRTDKNEVIEYVLRKAHISERERNQVVMIGDRYHDIQGARAAGIHSIGVLYGYGSRDELEKAGAERIAENPENIKKIILEFNTDFSLTGE